MAKAQIPHKICYCTYMSNLHLQKLSNERYELFFNEDSLGFIELLNNLYHMTNIYLKLELNTYDLESSCLDNLTDRDIQTLVEEKEVDKINFLELAGFKKVRTTEILKIETEGYNEETNITLIDSNNPLYKQAVQLLYKNYKETHKSVNPLSVDFEEFAKNAPTEDVYIELKNDEIINYAFIEDDEIAYIGSETDRAAFARFVRTLNYKMQEYPTLETEADDTDPLMAVLKEVLADKYTVDEVFYTYILEQ